MRGTITLKSIIVCKKKKKKKSELFRKLLDKVINILLVYYISILVFKKYISTSPKYFILKLKFHFHWRLTSI